MSGDGARCDRAVAAMFFDGGRRERRRLSMLAVAPDLLAESAISHGDLIVQPWRDRQMVEFIARRASEGSRWGGGCVVPGRVSMRAVALGDMEAYLRGAGGTEKIPQESV